MSKLANLKKWVTIHEALEELNTVTNQNITESDLYQLAIHNEIVLSTLLPNIHDFNPDFYVLSSEEQIERFTQADKKAQENKSRNVLTWEELDIRERTTKFDNKYYIHHQDYCYPNIIWNIRTRSDAPSHLLLEFYHATQFNQKLNIPDCCFIQSPDQSVIVRLKFYNILESLLKSFQFIIEKNELDRFINTLDQDTKLQKKNKEAHPRSYNNLVALIGLLLKHPEIITKPTHEINDASKIASRIMKTTTKEGKHILAERQIQKIIKDALNEF